MRLILNFAESVRYPPLSVLPRLQYSGSKMKQRTLLILCSVMIEEKLHHNICLDWVPWPHFYNAVHAATGHDFHVKIKGLIYGTKEAAIAAIGEPIQEEAVMLCQAG